MKKCILTSATVLFMCLTVFAQDLSYSKKNKIENAPGTGIPRDLSFEVKGRYTRPVTKEKLKEAKLITDIVPGYPSNWITSYVSVTIWATSNGQTMKAVSPNDALSTEQKNILNTVDPGTDIAIDVMYKYKDPLTEIIEGHKINALMTVVPEIEAEYVGGYQQMKKYLKENVINKISETTRKQFQDANAIVIFTVNEKGEVVNAEISKSSEDPKTDKLLVDAINKMPKWKPAETSKGIKVKQQFEFTVGNSGC